ncbi:MAG TPA: dihydrofolate reductase family protein [Rubrobacter sp.]|nr:dihydrofolate reductase family protein [Rubrobacter sp.]
MGIVTAHMSMSVDGYVAGPNAGAGNPLGDGGVLIQQWMFDLASFREIQGLSGGQTNADDEELRQRFAPTGAVVMGRRMFDEGEGPWGDNPPFRMPVFVLTHEDRDTLVKEGGTTFTFVTEGIESALEQAKAAAGDKNVNIAGGADTVQQFIRAGLLDELEIHLAPLLFGEGIRLFDKMGPEHIELENMRVVTSPKVTHLRFRVAK